MVEFALNVRDLAIRQGAFDLGPVSERPLLPTTIGRDEPVFRGEDNSASPLLDPCISRRQLAVTWSPERTAFMVTGEAEGRRPVRLFDLSGNELASVPAEVPPGTLVAIGDRVLLLLTVRPSNGAGDNLGLVGHSGQMAALRHRIAAVADMTDTVLVRGETGVGKELVARAIHQRGARRQGPFLALNCAALPEALIESELFGYAKGAFSGAITSRIGLFGAAHGGTLLLDEIGEMPLGTQAKLLRVLELRKVRPVGAQHEEPVDVRIVAATSRDLPVEVGAGRFRADLYSRIEAPLLLVPSLAQRREDVPLLFAWFLRRRAEEQARGANRSIEQTALGPLWRAADAYPPTVRLDQMLWLLRQAWPRNVRELDKVTAEVSAGLIEEGIVRLPFATMDGPLASSPGSPRARPDRAEMERLLEAHGFNQTEVARVLDVPYATLDRWLRELAVVRPRDLSADDIHGALQRGGGDLTRVASLLRVSLRGLKTRMNELGFPTP